MIRVWQEVQHRQPSEVSDSEYMQYRWSTLQTMAQLYGQQQQQPPPRRDRRRRRNEEEQSEMTPRGKVLITATQKPIMISLPMNGTTSAARGAAARSTRLAR